MKVLITVIALTVIMVATSAADTFRCPNGTIVSTGDRISEVVLKCDRPTFVYTYQQPEESYSGRIAYVEIQEWTYDQGRQNFVHFLVFRNGVLREIRSGGYGR